MAHDPLDEQIEATRRKVSSLEFDLAVERAVLNRLLAARQSGAGGAPGGVKGAVVPGSLAEKAVGVLRDKGKPMRARDITKILEANGERSGGKTSLLALVLSALRRRQDLFERTGRGVYRLKDQKGETDCEQNE